MGLAVWVGGFTFYSAAVIPVLHERLGGVESGSITGEVTETLNAVGVVTVIWWWGLLWSERGRASRTARTAGAALLAVSTAVLVGLIVLHDIMDARLEAGTLRVFYPLHRVYLIASTVQWVVNLGLFGTALRLWYGSGRNGSEGV